MNRIEKKAFEIVQSIPDIFSDTHALPRILDQIKSSVSAPHLLLAERGHDSSFLIDDVAPSSEFIRGYGDLDHRTAYFEHYRAFDDWECVENVSSSRGAFVYSAVPNGALSKSSEMWDWFNPIDIDENAFVRLCNTPNGWLGINLHYQRKHVAPEDICRLLNLIQKPLSKAIQLNMMGAGALIDDSRSTSPVFVLSPQKRLDSMNSAAERFVAEQNTMLARNGILRAIFLGHICQRVVAICILSEASFGKHQEVRVSFEIAKERFIADCEKRLRPITVREYRRHLNFFGFKKDLAQLERSDVYRKLDDLSETPTNQNYAFTALNVFFNWCVRNQYMDHNPIAADKKPARLKSRDRILDDEELKALYSYVRNNRTLFHDMVALLIYNRHSYLSEMKDALEQYDEFLENLINS